MSLDFPTTILILLNVTQMVSIMILVLPVFDIIILSKMIKQFQKDAQNSSYAVGVAVFYVSSILLFGILQPTKEFNTPKHAECPTEKLRHIIEITNASRNYLLGGLSLFFLLVQIRLCDYVHFSAKLHEFSDLMGNYEIIDIAYTSEGDKEPEPSYDVFDEVIEEEAQSVRWPSFVEFNQQEYDQIKTFFKATPKKTKANEGSPKLEEKASLEVKKESAKPTTNLQIKDSVESKTDIKIIETKSKEVPETQIASTQNEIIQVEPSDTIHNNIKEEKPSKTPK